jgi:hypothetical protein
MFVPAYLYVALAFSKIPDLEVPPAFFAKHMSTVFLLGHTEYPAGKCCRHKADMHFATFF